MPPVTLPELGWDAFFKQQMTSDELATLLPVRVMNVQRSALNVHGDGGNERIVSPSSDPALAATIGDWLLIDRTGRSVVRRLERKSLFKRRAPGTDRREQLIAANIDTLFIVSSCNQDFNEARLERYLAIAREAQVMAIVVLTKADLDDPDDYVSRAAKLAPAIVVEAVNALDRDSLQNLEPWLRIGQTVALLGSSGVGKSTLSNTLTGKQVIQTQAIREDDARGRHTTTSRSMYRLKDGAWLLDTPGMRELQLTDVKAGLDDVFAEISALAEHCRFADCVHDGEPGCVVQAAVTSGEISPERVERWRKLVREEANNSATLAERRARDKGFGRLYKSVIKAKKDRRGA